MIINIILHLKVRYFMLFQNYILDHKFYFNIKNYILISYYNNYVYCSINIVHALNDLNPHT